MRTTLPEFLPGKLQERGLWLNCALERKVMGWDNNQRLVRCFRKFPVPLSSQLLTLGVP